MPVKIPKLSSGFFKKLSSMSFKKIAFEVAKNLIGQDIPAKDLKKIINDAINFDAPLVALKDKKTHQTSNIHALELFHGPTLAFKDFGARFMSRLMAYFLKNSRKDLTILAATSGDTGSAVGHGFFNVKGIKVVLLYPSGKVSKIQEKQLTTIGGNVTALEIKGTFDDCQKLVKTAFTDEELNKKLMLSSANSINIARLIPQTFYYFYAYAQLEKICQLQKSNRPSKATPASPATIFSIPSGNFGNLTAGLIAKKMGLPIEKFIAATNANDIFPKYLATGKFTPKPSKKTISNAMDVGNPSNFARIKALYKNDLQKIRQDIWSKSYSDKKTKSAIQKVYKNSGYLMDPHGAVAYLGLMDYLKANQKISTELAGIFLETAHPAKFKDIVEPIIKERIKIPTRLAICLTKKKKSVKLPTSFKDLKKFLWKA